MNKTIILFIALLSLTACAQSRQESKDSSPSKTEQTSKESSTVKNEKGLQFVVGLQYEGKESNLIELGKKLTRNIQNLEIKEAYRSTIRAQLSHPINKNMLFFY